MHRTLCLFLFLTACESETWVVAPSVDHDVPIDADQAFLEGTAVLTYASPVLPPSDAIVSNALRLTVESSTGEPVTLDFPRQMEHRLGRFADPASLNLHGVFQACGRDRCVVEVPFTVTRDGGDDDVLLITGDALLSRRSVLHTIQPQSTRAALALRFD